MDYEIIAPSRGLLAQSFFQQTPCPADANPGLVFDRYLAIWARGKRAKELYTPLDRFVSSCNEMGSEQKASLLVAYHSRQKRIIDRTNHSDQTINCSLAWRLAMGLGNDHPLENGFTLDYLTGSPYIRATALKGLCRRVAVLSGQEGGWDKETQFDLFGSRDPMADDATDAKARGDIVFLDAYPTRWPNLEIEVMNPHHQQYYQGGELRETEDPVPVFFLTVGAGAEFVFRLFSRSGSETNAQKTRKALLEGLTLLGVGAKTAVGYGRFMPPQPPVTAGEVWLKKTVQELQVELKVSNEKEVLRGKPLATRWQGLPDGDLRQEVHDAIERRWRERGLFEMSGRSLNQVKQIYGW